MIKQEAFAKINLYLDVLDKRPDGYHNIKSVMQSVSLCDVLSLEVTDSQENCIEIICNSLNLKCDSSNLIYKAWERFCDAASVKNKKCTFTLEKNIPMSAGMAGGSSDCACALKLLNYELEFPLSENQLIEIGAKIGADVAFCIKGGTCICEGKGEILTPIKGISDVFIVCAIGNATVSTPYAFSLLDEKYGTDCKESGNIANILNALENGKYEFADFMYNKFESVICPLYNEIEEIKEIMNSNGAMKSLMSGSGPSVFGVFNSKKCQEEAYLALKNRGFSAFLCKTI